MTRARINPTSKSRARRQLAQCRYLGDAVRQYGPCKIDPGQADPFDTLISAIISQQLSVKAAETIEKRTRALVGKTFTAKRLASTDFLSLRDCGLSYRKVEYIQGIAIASESGELDFNQLAQATDQEVREALVKLRGVGHWTAEMFMIFSLGRIDIFSPLDVGLQRAMQQLFGEAANDLEAMAKLAERWQPYRSIASWYLWKLVD